jgi:Flp pilus assembly protein TadG
VHDDRGTVLFLFPAGFLVVLILAALAVDLTVVHLGEREAISAATAAANDAAGYGVDVPRYRETGAIVLDAERVEQAARAALTGLDPNGRNWNYEVELLGPTTVRITVEGEVEYVFASVIPGGPTSANVAASAVADARSR